MDFNSLTRRELQTLCKKNKIPANLTNVAMADALKHLDIVEGIEEFMQPFQSETAQSSLESPTRSEVTSPYVPPTGGRSTRRRNVVKEEPETVKPMTRSRRARNSLVNDANESQANTFEASASISQSDRKNNKLKEFAEVEKKDVLFTPAPLGVTSQRRRAKEETEVKRVYSTRRSARLAEKNVKMLNEGDREEPELFKGELVDEVGRSNVEVNSKDGLEDFDEVSGVTGVGADATLEENPENHKSEVVSAQKQDLSIGKEIKLGSTAEEERDRYFEADDPQSEVKESGFVKNEKAGFDFETGTELDKSNRDKTEDPYGENMIMYLNPSNEVQESEEERDCYFEADDPQSEVRERGVVKNEKAGFDFETGTELDKSNRGKTEDPYGENMIMYLNPSDEVQESEDYTEELNSVKDQGPKDKAADYVEIVVPECKANFSVDDLSCNTDIDNETGKELCNDKDVDSEHVSDLGMTLAKFTELRLQEASEEASPGRMLGEAAGIHAQLNKEYPGVNETPGHEENTESADLVPQDVDNPTSGMGDDELRHQILPGFAGLYSNLIVQPTSTTPTKSSASKASATMKTMTIFSDNKENIGSDSKLVPTEEKVKTAKDTVSHVDDLNGLSVRKLTKMLKEKLEITNKLGKNGHVNKALSRPALQALPENHQLVDETQK